MNSDRRGRGLAGPWAARAIDCLLIAIVFGAFAASPPPDVNEAHYLIKARQFWQPDWLPNDLFLASSFPHWLFYATFGWLAVAFDFTAAAWIGRIFGWTVLAVGWESLSNAFDLSRSKKVAAAVIFLGLSHFGNLSGEWIVGGIEAKVPAYALVLFGLGYAVQGRWLLVWPALGLASDFHVIAGGWSFLACLVVRIAQGRATVFAVPELLSFFCGAAIAMLGGVWPSLAADWGVDGATRALAAHVYVRERINHHLYFWDFSRASLLGFGVIVFVWREFMRGECDARMSVLHWFSGAALAFSVMGVALSSAANWEPARWSSECLLRFYWFRLADVAMPMTIAIAALINGNARRADLAFARRRLALAVLLLATCVFACAAVVLARWWDGRPGADRQSLPSYAESDLRTRQTQTNWVKVCRWIAANTPKKATFLTPRFQQTFTWYSGRAEFVNWKNVPQDARSIARWDSRMAQAYGPQWGEVIVPLLTPQDRMELLKAMGVDYVVMEQRAWHDMETAGPTDPFVRVYPEDEGQQTTYVVAKVQ